jgi:multiple sugar transport system permease protein
MKRIAGSRAVAGILLAVLVINLVPLYVMVSISIRGEGSVLTGLGDIIPGSPTLENYAEILSKGPFARYFLNSTIVVVCVVLGNVFLASMAAYAIARSGRRSAGFMLALVVSTMMVPRHILMIPLFSLLLRMRLIDTYYALILPFLIDAFNVFFIHQYVKSLPRELEEAAAIDGAGPFGIFSKIVFPALKPALVVVATNTFLINWNSFLLPFILTNSDRVRTLPVGLAIFSQGEHSVDWGLLMAGSTLAAIPTIVAFAIFQKHIVRGLTEGAIRG